MRLRPTRIEAYQPAPGTWQLYFDVPDVSLQATVGIALLVDGLSSNELTLPSRSAAVTGSSE